MLTVIEKVMFLQNADVFSIVPTEELAYLAAIAEEVSYISGDVIYMEHDSADALYIVIDGKVRLHKDDREITIADSKDAFGTWALFDETPRVVTATVLEESRLLRIDREDFYDILSDHVQIIQGIFKTLVKRLRSLADSVTYNQNTNKTS